MFAPTEWTKHKLDFTNQNNKADMGRQEVEYVPDLDFLNHVANIKKYKNKRAKDRTRWTGIEPKLMLVDSYSTQSTILLYRRPSGLESDALTTALPPQ
jgi:hypothetical protein